MSSLTSITRSKRTAPLYRECVVNPVPPQGWKFAFPPAKISEVNPTVIGHAYDIWVRCLIARHYGLSDFNPRNLIGYKKSNSAPGVGGEAANERLLMLYHQGIEPDDENPIAEEAADQITAYLNKQAAERNDDLLRACLHLGCFETVYRSGHWTDPECVDDQHVAELRRLAEVSDCSILLKDDNVILNPNFDIFRGSSGIKADGDLLQGETLIDLKSGRKKKLIDDWRQLAGYVVLNELSEEPWQIERVAVYYVRFGVYLEYAPDALFADGGRQKLRDLFIDELDHQDRARERSKELRAKWGID